MLHENFGVKFRGTKISSAKMQRAQRAQRKCPIFIALGSLQLGVFALETIQVVILKSDKIKAKIRLKPNETVRN